MATVMSSPSQMGRGTMRSMVEGTAAQPPLRGVSPPPASLVPLPPLRAGRIRP